MLRSDVANLSANSIFDDLAVWLKIGFLSLADQLRKSRSCTVRLSKNATG